MPPEALRAHPDAGVLGIDFGTSNSAAALVGDDGKLRVMALEPHNPSMPTALFFAAESERIAYGTQALQNYLKAAREQVPGGRLMRSIKSLLGGKLMDEHTLVNGQRLRFFDILVLFLRELKSRSEQQLGHEVHHALLGRPVHFVDADAQGDALAQATLERAALAAGFHTVRFQLEPIAAAFDFERRITRETTALVVDIGGGTSDFTVIRLDPTRQKNAQRGSDVLATGGIHLGGTDFDRLLNLGCVMPFLGLGHIGPSGREVPNSVFFDLSTWHLIHHAYARKSLHQASELRTSYADPALHRRLLRVLKDRQGHQILASVEAAKIACSSSGTPADIDLAEIEDDLSTTLSPDSLRQDLRQQLDSIVQGARQCARDASTPRPDVLYLTGGSSSLTPLVEALQLAFAGAHMVQGDRFGGVAAGLAWAGFVADRA